MDDTDIPAHLRDIQQDHYAAQQAHSPHRAAEGVERADPLNEPWQKVVGNQQPAAGQGYPQNGSFNPTSGYGQQDTQASAYPSGQPGDQAYLNYQYQGQQSTDPQFHGQGPQSYIPPSNSYQSHQSGYNDGQSGHYSGHSTGSNVPHSMEPPTTQQYASQPYHHGQPPGAHTNQNTFTAQQHTLANKLQDMHLAPASKHDNDPARVTEQMAQANVNGEKTMVPPNPLQYPPLLKPMTPHLQLMVGPLLAYSTVERNIWYGAALVVTFDSGSIYEPAPSLSLSFAPSRFSQQGGYYPVQQGQQGNHPMQVSGVPIYNYRGVKGTSTFWRMKLEIPLQPFEQTVTYRLNQGHGIEFLVPAIGMNMRWAAHSCNGFSGGVDMDAFKGPGFESGYDPLWADLLKEHDLYGLHALVGGGDQIYCDSITQEPELQDWVTESSPAKKMQLPLTDEIRFAVDRYYFSHYVRLFRSSKFAVANGCIPMLNMLDDHDLIDGFGSYDDETQKSPIFNHIGSRGYFWFLLFQLFCVDEYDGTHHAPGSHPIKGMVIGAPGAFIPHPNHTLISYLGPNVYMVLLDCRAERKLDQVCSKQTYDLVFSLLERLPLEVEQIVMLLGVPIVYPRFHIAEHILQTKFNPVNLLSRSSAVNLGGFSNKFDSRPELLDDLNDHWCAKGHKTERNDLIKRLQDLALRNKYRITFLSGDVHCAAVGELHTLYHMQSHKIAPAQDYRYMLNVITSAIVNTPPPMAPQLMVNQFATHKHRTLHHAKTDEIMVCLDPKDPRQCPLTWFDPPLRQLPLFEIDVDGTSRKNKYVIGRRNYAIARMDPATRDLIMDIRIEIVQGEGNTKPYTVIAPRPTW